MNSSDVMIAIILIGIGLSLFAVRAQHLDRRKSLAHEISLRHSLRMAYDEQAKSNVIGLAPSSTEHELDAPADPSVQFAPRLITRWPSGIEFETRSFANR